MSDTNRENDPMDEFLRTLGDEPQETKALRVPEVIPTIHGDVTNTESNAGPDGQTPLEGSDAEAYAALKAKRAERRRKKLVRRGIVIGVAAVVIGGGAIAINILGKEPEQMMEAVTDFAVQGDFETIVDAKGTLQPLSATVITPEVGGQIESVNVVAGQTVKEGDVLMTIKNPEARPRRGGGRSRAAPGPCRPRGRTAGARRGQSTRLPAHSRSHGRPRGRRRRRTAGGERRPGRS